MEQRIRILLADDNGDFCWQLRLALERVSDFEVVGAAHDGLQTVELVRQTQPALLILDLRLSKLDGIGVLQRLQQMLPRPQVLVLTGFLTSHTQARAAALGVRHFVNKPCDFSALIDEIREMMSDHTHTALPCRRMEELIAPIVCEVGVPPHVKSYRYLLEAIRLTATDMDVINAVTKELYPQIAAKFSTTPSRVERAIRYAVKLVWERTDPDDLQYFFGDAVAADLRRPTNSEFIALLADRLRFRLRGAQLG